jgi:hypothetical protein
MNIGLKTQTAFARFVSGRAAAGPDAIEAMRRQAWREQGIICLSIQDIPDAETRQSLQSLAESKWGKR